jgi:hypothetical protein
MECNIGQDAICFNSFGNALFFMYIYKGRHAKISANIAFYILQRNLREIFDTIL